MTVSGSKRGSCVKYSEWEPSGLDDKYVFIVTSGVLRFVDPRLAVSLVSSAISLFRRAVICVREADSDFTPYNPVGYLISCVCCYSSLINFHSCTYPIILCQSTEDPEPETTVAPPEEPTTKKRKTRKPTKKPVVGMSVLTERLS